MSRHRRSFGRDVNGILLLNKSTGISSNFALQKVKKIYNANKAGHTGALDPLATGMLPICLGEATKFSQYLLDSDKCYEVTAQLGVRTDTSDSEGQMIEEHEVDVRVEEIERALNKFRGNINQVPSMYSALKYQGKPLYQYAREGITVDRPARPITVYEFNILDFSPTNKLKMYVHCSKGTYVRTLVDDLGQELGCGACVIQLNRTKVAGYPADRMLTIEQLNDIYDDCVNKSVVPKTKLDQYLLPIDSVVSYMPKVTVSLATLQKLMNGQYVNFRLDQSNNVMVRLYLEGKDLFLGVGEYQDGKILPRKLVRSEEIINIAASTDNN